MPWRQCCPSHAQGDPPQLQGPEAFDPALSCRKMPIAHPRPPTPPRCLPRSADLSILSRSLARPRKAEQGGSDDRREGRRRMTSDTTVSAHPKASGRLAYPRYSRRRRLSSHAGQLAREGGRMTSDIALSARPKASGRLAHSRSSPSSGVSAANPAAGRSNWRILTRSKQCSWQSFA
jgi:hypothetical protein